MLDPNPKTRITARQLLEISYAGQDMLFKSGMKLGCERCQNMPYARNQNLPIHSVIKRGIGLDLPWAIQPLELEVAPNWEAAKRLWLAFHMWW
jgi:hypothetical protein